MWVEDGGCVDFWHLYDTNNKISLCFRNGFGNVPNLKSYDDVIVTFICKEGSPSSGNEVLTLKRYK